MIRPAFRRAALAVPVTLAALALLPSGIAFRDLSYEAPGGGRIAIGRLALDTAWPAALAQGDAAVTMENVTLASGATTVLAPRIEVRGTALGRPDLATLLDLAAPEPWAARLARLTAREIVVPELRVEQTFGGRKQFAVYRDLTARDVVAGRAARIEAAGAEIRVEAQAEGGSGRYGRMSASEVDLGEMARLYTERADAPGAMRRIYGPFSVDGITFADRKGVEFRIGRAEGGGFSARPVKDSWGGLTEALGAMKPNGGSPEERSRLMSAVADMLDAFEAGPFAMSDLTVKDPSAKQPVDLRIAKIAYSGAGRAAEFRIDDTAIGTPDGQVKLASIVSSGFSLAPTLEGLRALSGKKPDEVDPADMRRLAPVLGSLRLSGLSFDGIAKGGEPPLRVGVRSAEIKAERPVNGVPTDSRVAINGLTLTVPPDTKENGLKEIAALGYGTVDLSWLFDVGWNEPTGELAVREVSLSGRDMGVAKARATISGLTKDAFDPDSAVAAAALFSAAAKRLDVTIENGGLFERILSQQAKTQSRTPEELRRDYAMLAAAGIPAVLGNTPAAKILGQAVSRFVARPGKLTVTAVAKDPGGLAVSDFAAAPAPGAILDLVDLTAVAE